MSILDWIEKTRGKPETARRRIALGITLLVTVVIAIVWLTIVFVSGGQSVSEKTADVSSKTPFSIISDTINEIRQ